MLKNKKKIIKKHQRIEPLSSLKDQFVVALSCFIVVRLF